MRNFGLAMYNLEKNGVFPIKSQEQWFETIRDAEDYCTKLNKKLKSGSYWKVARIGSF